MKTYGKVVLLGILLSGLRGSTGQAATIAQFDFDVLGPDGKTVVDLSGNGHDAVHCHPVSLSSSDPFNLGLSSSVYQAGINGTAYYYATLQNPGTINLRTNGNNFTLEAWINPTKYVSGIFRYENLWGGNGDHLYSHLSLDAAGHLVFKQTDDWAGVGTNVVSPGVIPQNTWTHVAVVVNSGMVHLYVNGEDVVQGPLSWNPNFGCSVFYIGNSTVGEWNGWFDDVRISDTALDPSQLGYNHSFTTAPTPTPIAKFNFDTISLDRTRVPDLSGNGHDAVFALPVTPPSPEDPFNVPSSQSVYVNSDDSGRVAFLQNPGAIDLRTAGSRFTLECWFKPEVTYYGSTLVQLGRTGGPNPTYAGIGMREDGRAAAFLYVADFGWKYAIGPALSAATWYHLAGTYSGGTLRLYVNGAEVASAPVGVALPDTFDWAIIGGQGTLGDADGWIDDVMISGYAKETGDFVNLQSFTPGTVYADAYGFDPADATAALQNAINSGAGTVIIRNMGSPWYIAKTITINWRTHLTLQFENGVQIRDQNGAFWDNTTNCKLFQINCGDHLLLDGYGAEFKMRKSQYTAPPYLPSPNRIALACYGARDLTIQGLTLRDSGGDGLYFDSGWYHGANILVKDVLLDNHYRNGISVCDADNMTLDNVTIQNTGGTWPQLGIDFEPNYSYDRLKDIVVRNCTLTNNAAGGICFSPSALDSTQPVSITVRDSAISGGSYGIRWLEEGQSGKGRTGTVLVDNVTVSGVSGNGIHVSNKTSDPGIAFNLRKIQLTDTADNPIIFYGDASYSPNSPLGNVRFDYVTVTDAYDRPFLTANTTAQELGFRDITGNFAVDNPYGASWTLGGNLSRVRITALAGDSDYDHRVTFGDFAILQNHYGHSGVTWDEGDFNGDGWVTFEDFSILQNHYGQSMAGVVPAAESPIALGLCLPLGLGLLTLLGMGWIFWRNPGSMGATVGGPNRGGGGPVDE